MIPEILMSLLLKVNHLKLLYIFLFLLAYIHLSIFSFNLLVDDRTNRKVLLYPYFT